MARLLTLFHQSSRASPVTRANKVHDVIKNACGSCVGVGLVGWVRCRWAADAVIQIAGRERRNDGDLEEIDACGRVSGRRQYGSCGLHARRFRRNAYFLHRGEGGRGELFVKEGTDDIHMMKTLRSF
jgi:hypothetical protein